MDDRALADSLVTRLGVAAGLPELVLDDEGTCSLEFDGSIVLNLGFDDRDGSLMLFSKLPTLADDKLAFASRLMLEANHFGSGTGGGMFSLAKGLALPMLSRRLFVRQIDSSEFEQIVTEFVGLVELWTKAFSDFYEGGTVEPPSTAADEFVRV
jgi:hypothetical protein